MWLCHTFTSHRFLVGVRGCQLAATLEKRSSGAHGQTRRCASAAEPVPCAPHGRRQTRVPSRPSAFSLELDLSICGGLPTSEANGSAGFRSRSAAHNRGTQTFRPTRDSLGRGAAGRHVMGTACVAVNRASTYDGRRDRPQPLSPPRRRPVPNRVDASRGASGRARLDVGQLLRRQPAATAAARHVFVEQVGVASTRRGRRALGNGRANAGARWHAWVRRPAVRACHPPSRPADWRPTAAALKLLRRGRARAVHRRRGRGQRRADGEAVAAEVVFGRGMHRRVSLHRLPVLNERFDGGPAV